MNNNKKNFSFILIALAFILLLSACSLGAKDINNNSSNNNNNIALPENNVSEDVQVEANNTDAPAEEPDEPAPEEIKGMPEEVNLLELFSPFWESRSVLQEYYIAQPIDDEVLVQGAIDGLVYALENNEIDLESIIVPEDAQDLEALALAAGTNPEVIDTFLPYWEVWQKTSYAAIGHENLTAQYLMQESISWMVASLGDQHTSYMDPDSFAQSQERLDGSYEGIGAWVDISTEYLTIISPMPGSPAEAAGLKTDDRVIAVDGDDMTGIDGSLVIRRVLGPAGSTVVLTIDRDGVEEPFDVTIKRATIIVPSVESEILEGGIGYIHLYTFGADSAEDFHTALEALMDEHPAGLIVDLRGNGGGYLGTAVNITSEFISEGVILYEEYADGSRDIHYAQPNGLATEDIPIVVLVNEGSASASEILAGAIRDYERGILLGTTTFGKGSVQYVLDLSDMQGAVRVTIARWLTPSENLIHHIGFEPDIVVEITEEDIEADNDPQLQAAIDYLLDK